MQPPGKEARGRDIWSAVGLFTAGFLAVALLLHTGMHEPLRLHADERSEKLQILDRLQGTVFSGAFGSSHVHNGFDPRVFDRVLWGSAAQTHTVNLAISGGSQAEQRAMALEFLDHLRAPPSRGACLVILELNAGANFSPDHLIHPRSINVYDWKTARFISHLTSAKMDVKEHVGRVGFAIAASALHYMNIGMLSNSIFAPPIDSEEFKYETEDDRRGVKIEPYNTRLMPELRGETAGGASHAPVEPGLLTPGNDELIEELAARSPVSNLQFVYFVFPKLSDLSAIPDYPDDITVGGRVVPIINLARPDRFPALYDPELWHDDAHFNGTGAERVSQAFAEQLTAWYAAHGEPSPCGT